MLRVPARTLFSRLPPAASARLRLYSADTASTAPPPKPLEGVLVLSLEQAVAAPYCTSRLADAGARVIKVERSTTGDFARQYDSFAAEGLSSYFVWLNRGKQSLTANIKEPADQELLHSILEDADVFVQNLAPGAAARAGLGSAELRRTYPRLITVDISGYGDGDESGTYGSMKAYDLLVQAESGMCSVTGTADGMGRVGVSIADITCGMFCHSAVLEALLARKVTGEGCTIDASLFSALGDIMSVPLYHYEADGRGPARVGLKHPSIHPYGSYDTRPEDGEEGAGAPVLFSIQNEREWAKLCADVLERPEVATDPRFLSNAERCINAAELDLVINSVFREVPRSDLLRRLRDAGVAFGEVNDLGGLSRHPALRRIKVDTAQGPLDAVAPPARFNGQDREFGAVPSVGQHDAMVREEFAR